MTLLISNKNRIAYFYYFLLAMSFILQMILDLLENNEEGNFLLFINIYISFFSIIGVLLTKGFNKHLLLFLFYACFFTFLLGQKFFVVLNGGEYDAFLTFKYLKLNQKQYFIFANLIYISLLIPFITYDVLDKNRTKKIEHHNNDRYLFSCRRIIRFLYIITWLCALAMQIAIYKAKSSVSYTDGYLINVDINPIIKIGNYLYFGFALAYLACKPSKKEMWLVLLSFILVDGVIQLFIGKRMEIAKSILFIIWYITIYYKMDKNKIKGGYLILFVLIGAIMIVVFWAVERLRAGAQLSNNGIISIFEKFFTSTGGSDSTIANCINKQSEFNKPGYVYYFSPIWEAVLENPFMSEIRKILGYEVQEAVSQGEEYLVLHDSFSHWLSYLVNSELYLKGYGMGSSYIAETYLAFGVFGVFVFSLILGVIISRLHQNGLSGKLFKDSVVLFFVMVLFGLPRSGPFGWALSFIYFIASMIIIRFCIFIFSIKKGEK